jgi:hypothetical protein
MYEKSREVIRGFFVDEYHSQTQRQASLADGLG